MPTPTLPFQGWTQDECEFLMEILGNSMIRNASLARLLIPEEFARIKADDQDTRQHYFKEAKKCCQRQLTALIKEGTRKLVNMTIKDRARSVLICKCRFEAFLVEIARCLEIYTDSESSVSNLVLLRMLYLGRKKGLCGAFDRVLRFMMRELVCSSRGCANYITKERQPRVLFDQYLRGELELLQGLNEKDLVGGGVGAKLRRGRNIMRFLVGNEQRHSLS